MWRMENGQKVPTLIDVFGKVPVLIGFASMAWVLVNVVVWNLVANVGWLPEWLALILGTGSALIVSVPCALFLQRRRRGVDRRADPPAA